MYIDISESIVIFTLDIWNTKKHSQHWHHIGASWTEGGKWKCGKFSILGASNEKSELFSLTIV